MKDNHANKYLQKALFYDQLANYYKYIDPSKHMMYYQKHFSYMQLLIGTDFRDESPPNIGRTVISKIRVFHAAVDSPAVDIFINGRKAFQNLQFKLISDYLRLAPGDYAFTVFQSGQTDTPLFKKNISIQPGKTYTITVGGMEGHLDLTEIMDHKYVPVGETRMRFIHLSHDTPHVDIAVRNGDILFSNVGFKYATKYLRMSPMTIDLEVRVAGTNDVILSLSNTKLRPNRAVTIALIGFSNGIPHLEALPLTP